MHTTALQLQDVLPLTCSRKGTCCHGNRVLLNPWELFCLAREKKMTPRAFRDAHTTSGGTQLLFNGKLDARGKQACSLYIENFGCSVHLSRPLACRLFPIGRQLQSGEVHYMYEGNTFPCLDGCAEVLELPQLTVGEYLAGQKTADFETAQDEYLELMQNLADMSFELLLETDLATSGVATILPLWKEMGNEAPEMLATRIGSAWMDALLFPEISVSCTDARSFVQQHSNLLQERIQESFATLEIEAELQTACITLMGIALQLARCIGANPSALVEHWCDTAKGYLEK